MSIIVSLDVNAKPPVTVSPSTYDVTSKGLSEIAWTPATGQTFTFVSLTFNGNAQAFSAPTVAKSAIYVNDNNTNAGPAIGYAYTIVVSQNGVNYSSVAVGIGGTGGTPTIRNH